MKQYFRIWCNNNNEWEKDICFLTASGKILYFRGSAPYELTTKNHKIELNTGFIDKNGNEIFVGDIVREADGNCGYGRLRDYYLDGYFYFIVTENYIDELSERLHESNRTWVEVYGNIHETELNDSAKYWTDPEFAKKFRKKHGANGVW